MAHLDIPTLLIWGEHDQIVPRAVGEQMAALLVHAQLRVIDGCGHLPQQECPQELVEAISSLDVNPCPLPQIHAYGKIDDGATSDPPQ